MYFTGITGFTGTARIKPGRWRCAALALWLVLPVAPAMGQDAFQDPFQGSFQDWGEIEDRDPFVDINRVVFGFNDYFDNLLLRPLAVGYSNHVPTPVRAGVGNFFSNIEDINTMANNLLQGKVGDAVSDCGRILINSTVGVGGLIDVASELGLEKHQEDFGQTLGVWGVEAGPYVVLPIFGASSVRDTFGFVIDSFANPVYYLEHDRARVSTYSVERVDWRSGLLSAEQLVTGDSYLFVREAQFQSRDFAIKDGKVDDLFGDF